MCGHGPSSRARRGRTCATTARPRRAAEMETTMTHSGDMIDGRAYSVDELRRAVFQGRGELSRPLALGLLARKEYPKKVADLQQILVDEKEQARLRAVADRTSRRLH